MANTSKSQVKIIFGAMTIGKPGVEMTRVTTLEDTKNMIDIFQQYGHDTIDTARVYGEGSSEEYLGQLALESRGIHIDTKLYPTALRPALSKELYHHNPEDMRAGIMKSLKALQTNKVHTWYLHGPDRTVDWTEMLRQVNELHQEGLFEQWGFSNYQAWEVAKMCQICEANNWIKPSVCQGLYNAFHRVVEAELLPCLRHYGISFYCFNPLAGGLLTSRYTRDTIEFEAGSRFDPKTVQGQFTRMRYYDSLNFDALEILRPIAKKHGLSETECALRWLEHHSFLKQELGDGIVLGASSVKHLQENLEAVEKGPLPDEVVEALNEGWQRIRCKELKYWH